MYLLLLLTLFVVGVLMLVLVVALALWIRTIRARRRAMISRFAVDAPQLAPYDEE